MKPVLHNKLLESISGVANYMAATLPSGFTIQTSSGPITLSDFSSFIIEGLGKLELSKKVDNEVFVKPLVAIILLELSGCEDILETKSIEGAVSLVPVVTSESSDVSGDEKKQREKADYRGQNHKESHTTSESYQDLEISSPTFQHLKMKFKQLCQATFQAGNMIDAEVMSVLTGLHTVLKVIRYSCATIDDRVKTARPQTAKEGKQHPLMWYSLEDLQQVLSVLVRTLKLQKTTDKEVFSKVFSVVADCVGLLMSTSDGMRSLPKVSHECCWILSFPWLPFHSNWMDLKISSDFSDDKEVVQLSNEVNSKIDDESIATCLKISCPLSQGCSPKMEVDYLKNSIVVVKAGLNSFQYFLFHLGANYIHLLQDIVLPHVDGCSDCIAESLARVVGPILCVLNKQCSLNWNVEPNQKSMPLPEIVCSVCTGDSIPAEHIEARVVSPFLALLSRKTDTKLALIRNLPSIFQHLDLQHPNTAVSKVVKACMELSTDKQQEVRDEFRKRLKFLVNSGKPCSSSNIKAVISKLKSAFDSAKAASDCRLAESVVIMLGELGRVADGELLLVVIISLLDSLLSSSNLVKAAALLQVKSVSSQLMHGGSSEQKEADITLIADTVASALEFADTKTFLSKNLKLVLPLMVKKASEVSTALLRVLGELLQMKHRELLVINFKYVFSYLVRNCSKDELEKALFYVHRETEFDFSSLLHIDYQSFHNELLLHLSENYSKVFSGLAMLAAKDDSYNGPRPITQTEDMADFLQPRLLGILAFFDSQLLNSHIPLEDKKLALESLVCIMRLMGPKHITGVRVKVMTTLKIGLQYKEHGFPLLSCRAWDCYVRSVEPSALGPMLSQVIVTLLPLLQELPSQVSAIFHFLIVENQKTFSDHFRELYFMPSLVELQEVNKVIARHKEHHSTQPDVRNQLREAMKGVAHDSVDVRVHALSKLRDLLYTNQSSLHEFVMGSEDVDSIITELLSVLLSGCRDSNSEAQSLFGECLGALGAVDPGLLDLSTATNVDDMNFAYDLIIELARGFLAASDTRAQDCSAYAIQEMLQVYRCGSKESTSRDVPKPIYRSAKGSTYKDWVCFWTGHLVNMMVKEEKSSTVFKACRVIIKHDINTALFLLPYILQHVLIDSNQEQKAEIQDEILAVLRHDDGKAREESHLSAQTVFSVLDHLTRWKQQRAQELMSLAKTQSKAALAKAASHDQDAGILAVTKFLKQIPQDVLSRASYQCKAYARALMHFEAHLKSDGNNLQNHLPFLQKIYVALDEPDGVLGVSATRMVKPTLNDQILDHESKGKLGEAQACYEQAIQLDPNHLGNHQGLLKSLMDLGQLNTALNLVNGVLADKPALTSQLNAYRVEACWKLSRWDSLETHLQKETSTSDWRIGLGRILLAVRNKDLSEFEKQLKVVRSAQMGPLSAASMEKGSYQRGYEFITRLHMLSDLERGLKQLVSSEVGEDSRSRRADERLFSEWNNRLALTQASFRVQEPLLCMRRIILGLFDPNNHPSVKQEIGQSWLKSAKVARKANQMQTAYSFLLNASYYSLPEFFLEKAEWLWNKGDGHQALICLQNGVAEHFPPSKMQQNLKQREAHAKALLLIGRCMEDTAKFESNSVMKQYKEVSDVHPEWEDGYFYMAKYYDRLMLNFTDRPEKAGEFVIRIIQNFGQSLRYGNQHIYQSMPRLLSHWLDFGAHVAELENMKGRTKSDKVENIKAVLSQLNAMVKDFTNKLAPYQFLTSFSQLISRICHAHPAVFQHLTEIISKVLAHFPQQSVWMSMAVSKSTNQMRQLRCRDIFRRATQLDKNLEKFIRDATKLTDRLLELCNKSVERDCNLLSINKDFRNLKRLVTDRNFSQIIVPLQSLMTVTLPSTQTAHKQHDPFPTTPVYISGFDDGVEVLASLQQPKKISIQGNDGKVYAMLCKPRMT
ncbi:putative serine/threonine-protein kinase atr [Apostichopus japonicus]|uniref:non-specific serine/threonine protein kinase n=1 Tax=Stichopus japonicus TaxID=307972 RepID=A0A2G8L5H4_STIJA|nr:putative serine/threonine-protein kinase atr [Apostichopus japonicus]